MMWRWTIGRCNPISDRKKEQQQTGHGYSLMCPLGIPLTLPYFFPGQHKKKKLGRLEKSAAAGAPRFLRGSACPPQMHNLRSGQQQGICGAVSSRAYAWVARHPMARVYGHEMGAAATAVQPPRRCSPAAKLVGEWHGGGAWRLSGARSPHCSLSEGWIMTEGVGNDRRHIGPTWSHHHGR